MIYIIAFLILCGVAAADTIKGPDSPRPSPLTPGQITTGRARKQARTPRTYRNPYELRPYPRTRARYEQPRRPQHPIATRTH